MKRSEGVPKNARCTADSRKQKTGEYFFVISTLSQPDKDVLKELSMNMEHNVKKILIVEDDLALKPIWEKFFRLFSDSIRLEWAVSCEEATKMVQIANETGISYFLIISDIFLAGSKTGIQLLNSREVQASHAKKVLISAADRDDVISKYGHEMPDTLVISKPFSFRQYNPLFKHLLNGHLVDEQVGHET